MPQRSSQLTSAGDQRTIPMLCMVFMFGLFIPSFIPQQSISSTTFGRTLLSVSKSHVSQISYKFISFFSYFPNSDEIEKLDFIPLLLHNRTSSFMKVKSNFPFTGLHNTSAEHGDGIARVCHHHYLILSLLCHQV